ncbi:hypothetical protein ACFQRL_11365 [Microbacterium fluvii]|uniref:Uncharacterized protein n=1 Tax=Microbacterium fluvii TaxID=415215 RepID=A0ABW2HEP5_9MICO|nr:hypothetical protein [Microbacterium fluvii]MCU4673193.1 hypothetical protein [Microbacterium fluvii]
MGCIDTDYEKVLIDGCRQHPSSDAPMPVIDAHAFPMAGLAGVMMSLALPPAPE